jgi:nitrile hydratase accessory protein
MSATPRGPAADLVVLPRDAEGAPVFSAPWEAQAFAMAVQLQDRGLFTAAEWAEALGAALRETDDYYRAWLTALERLVVEKGAAAGEALASDAAAWTRADARTPHGTPIELSEADFTSRSTPSRP